MKITRLYFLLCQKVSKNFEKMKKLFTDILIFFIKIYKILISPVLGNNCRYLPSCSDYFIESLRIYGILKGSVMGLKRILSCHPIKILGGGEGLDLVEKDKEKRHG
tara:strand:+ start:52 stop:369 length:318 start_codon:yes stop_codon:yes gene_type:complete